MAKIVDGMGNLGRGMITLLAARGYRIKAAASTTPPYRSTKPMSFPGCRLLLEYASAKHDENAAQELLTQCAAALGYEMLKDRRVANVPGYGGLERRFLRERRRFVERRAQKERRKPATHPQRLHMSESAGRAAALQVARMAEGIRGRDNHYRH